MEIAVFPTISLNSFRDPLGVMKNLRVVFIYGGFTNSILFMGTHLVKNCSLRRLCPLDGWMMCP